ncbi:MULTISPECIES: hypothetical protein [unclassified Streptomyces]|uniref:hypothetical protein n=1 Tax=unclassified Streptomyces TaxID=2593676 RepID=UPI0019090792|nr:MULTISPECIES: hypothetical protein [unclassified Streptomyces]MBK3564119.1 hypothetical protein [Streptomyces sp. MBT62]MBK6012099.1 hypothetical protein [Streptomyces sp. MBT53]
MPPARPRILYVTDLAYQARGRRYCDEDIDLTSRLREDFDLALCHPLDAAGLMDGFDAVVVRNSGPVLAYQTEYDAFRERATEAGTRVYNQLSGRADMAGKQYLLDLGAAGFPVIPTVDRIEDLDRLPLTDKYVVKPKLGADSIGLQIVSADRLPALADGTVLVQPCVDFSYEVSFYFVDHDFQYALYAPDTEQRWRLETYEPTAADLEFAQRFVDWNTIDHGIQRVDACRAPDGGLLLVELEDLNPYLSLEALDDTRRDAFVAALKASLHRFVGA